MGNFFLKNGGGIGLEQTDERYYTKTQTDGKYVPFINCPFDIDIDAKNLTTTGTITAGSFVGVLANGVTATTQTAGDDSGKVATTAYVDALDVQTFWDRDAGTSTLSPHTDGDSIYINSDIVATGTGTFGGTSSGVSIFNSGLSVNSSMGITTNDDTVLSTGYTRAAFVVDANEDAIIIGVPINSDVNIVGDLTAVSFDGTLVDGVTGVTQSEDDNSTKISTTAYTDNIKTKYELFTISISDLANKYITIVGVINNNQSIRVFLNNIGIKAEQGVDYSLSGNQIFWTGYDLETTLEENDKLKIVYV